MNRRITRREVARQFMVAIELLLEWIKRGSNLGEETVVSDSGDTDLDTRLLTSSDVARILNITNAFYYSASRWSSWMQKDMNN